MIVVVMGVSGCGKSTVGEALAESLGWRFLDADDFHPPANVAKMAAGTPLVDEDRWPWLDRLAAEMRAINAGGGDAVLACSALRQAYRDRLAAAGDVRFVHLAGDLPTIAARLASRQHRYMPQSLLASQFATLEPPADAIGVDVRDPVAVQIAAIRAALGLKAQAPR
jgi:gluconokinase